MRYPHTLRLWIPSPDVPPGSQSADTGKWTPNVEATDVVLYDGPADVQDNTRKSLRDEAGRPNLNADAWAYLGDEFALTGAGGSNSAIGTDNGDGINTGDDPPVLLVTTATIRIHSNVYALITYEDGTTERATVMGVRNLDGIVMLRRMTRAGEP